MWEYSSLTGWPSFPFTPAPDDRKQRDVIIGSVLVSYFFPHTSNPNHTQKSRIKKEYKLFTMPPYFN
jgi:hypothetical protein